MARIPIAIYIGVAGLVFVHTSGTVRAGHSLKAIVSIALNWKGLYLRIKKAKPLVWSTGLMSPEAYTLHDAIERYMANDNDTEIAINAAKAYSKYQKCSLHAARKLLATGF